MIILQSMFQRYRYYAFALMLIPSLFGMECAFSIELKQGFSPMSQQKQAVAMMDVTTEADGTEVVRARWAIGSRENVETIHIPMRYFNPISVISCTSEHISSVSCKLGYVVDLTLDVDLSDYTSIASPTNAEQKRNLRSEFFVRSVLQGTKELSVRQWRNIDIEVDRYMMTVGPGKNDLPVVSKDSVFDLNVIGLKHGPKSDAAPTYSEIFYDGETPVLSKHVVVCGESKSSADDPSSMLHYSPQCQQYVEIDSISAVAKIRYSRDNLAHWREIDAGARTLLNSFRHKEH